jgi:hypothetical protein
MIGKIPTEKASMLICRRAGRYRRVAITHGCPRSTATREEENISPPEIEWQLSTTFYGTRMAVTEWLF